VTDQLPFNAVAFTPGALLSAEAAPGVIDPSRPGARRLVKALVQRGIRLSVVVDPSMVRHDDVVARLTEAGLAGLPVIATTGGEGVTDQARRAAHEIVVLPPAETLIVTSAGEPQPPPEVARTFAGVVVVDDLRPTALPLLSWLAEVITPFNATALMVAPPDDTAAHAAGERHLSLTKPPGSLGRLEALGVQLAGIWGTTPPLLPLPATVAIFAADHGVHAQGVSPWPQEVTTQMVANFVTGGAAINVLARQMKAEVVVVDVGVAGDLPPAPGLIDCKIARGTADLSLGPTMTADQAIELLDVGAQVAVRLVEEGANCLVTGDMGIGNTTASAAVISALTGRRAGDITGKGAGLPDADLPRKAAIVAGAAGRARERHGDDAFRILTEVGGFEHAALVGFIVGGASLGVPVVVDGVIAAAALLVAARMVPDLEKSVIAGHRSTEPASAAVLDDLGMSPVVDLDLRLGEGSGAILALPLLEAAVRVLGEMATFDEAGVSAKQQGDVRADPMAGL
jgi:nicotinate-nucleotide--dimethylbenzimidazole phosphoribosyltransferase